MPHPMRLPSIPCSNRMAAPLLLATALLDLAGCAKFTSAAARGTVSRPANAYPARSMDLASAPVSGYTSAPNPVYVLQEPGSGAAAEFDAPAPPPPQGSNSDPAVKFARERAGRQVAYSGGLKVSSHHPALLLDSCELLARRLGGYVETRSGQTATLRVPVARFDSLFHGVGRLGAIVSSWRKAEDVTEALQADDLELELKRTHLARLRQILARETAIEKRAELMEEMTRVSEEIEKLLAARTLLQNRVRLSSLEVQAVDAVARVRPQREIPDHFQWLSGLMQPIWTGVSANGWMARDRSGLPLAPSMEFVRIREADGAQWNASASDGATLLSFQRENSPRGDALFWLRALAHHRNQGLGAADTSVHGTWTVLRARDASPGRSQVWWTGFRTLGDKVQVVQATFPDTGSESRHRAAVDAILKETRP